MLNELVKQKESAQQIYGKMEEIRQAAQVDLPRLYANKKRLEQLQQDRPGRLIIDQLADSGQEDMDIFLKCLHHFLKKERFWWTLFQKNCWI